MRPPSGTPQEFVIRGGGCEFENRRKEMFAQLTQAEKEFSKDQNSSSLSEADQEILRHPISKHKRHRPLVAKSRTKMIQYRGKESIFKQPNGPAPLSIRKTIPDHHRNPHKWTKYSLEDVEVDKMSDKTNAEAAFSFLRELRARKTIDNLDDKLKEDMETESLETNDSHATSVRRPNKPRITFRKPSTSRSTDESTAVIVDNNDKPTYQNSKIVLPEYVVGQKQKKLKTSKPVEKVDRSKQLKLSHLDEIDE